MSIDLSEKVAEWRQLTVNELRKIFAELFGDATQSSSKCWLIRRMAWRMQSLQEGDLSQRAKRRAEELGCDADLRVLPPRRIQNQKSSSIARAKSDRDPRLPAAGVVLARVYKGETYHVSILPSGFEMNNQVFRSLSAVAQAITGSHCNGFTFFGLAEVEKRRDGQ